MKKLFIILGFSSPVILFAQDFKPFNPKAGLSLAGGIQYNKYYKAPVSVYGIEFSMECPLDQGKKNHIRQKLSIIRQEGKEYKSVAAEINPQYKLIASPSFEWCIGPVAGVIFTRIRDNNQPVFTYGAGTGAVYYFKKVFIGIESRYGITKKIAFDKISNESGFAEVNNLNNLRTFIKLGYRL
jgi:hypothetical protein